jgi:hypothetical protein
LMERRTSNRCGPSTRLGLVWELGGPNPGKESPQGDLICIMFPWLAFPPVDSLPSCSLETRGPCGRGRGNLWSLHNIALSKQILIFNQ